MASMTQRLLFRLTDSHLLVGNTGKAFSREGLKAICYTDTSAEESGNLADRVTECEARGWVEQLLAKKKQIFSDLDQLGSGSGTELRTARDYSARLLLELLQNAIDAGRDEQIGPKGIGFRSVLNGTESVEIHSGNLHARWSEQDARTALAGMGDLPDRLPILDLPAWHDPDDEIVSLRQEYDTVIRLILTDEGRKHVTDEWGKFSADASLLLFIEEEI